MGYWRITRFGRPFASLFFAVETNHTIFKKSAANALSHPYPPGVFFPLKKNKIVFREIFWFHKKKCRSIAKFCSQQFCRGSPDEMTWNWNTFFSHQPWVPFVLAITHYVPPFVVCCITFQFVVFRKSYSYIHIIHTMYIIYYAAVCVVYSSSNRSVFFAKEK